MRKEIQRAFSHIHEAVTYIENHSIENKSTIDMAFKEKITVAANDIFAEIQDLQDEICSLETKVDKAEDELTYVKEDLSEAESAKDDAEANLDGLEDLVPQTLYDQLKNKILSNLSKNLNLEQLEALEKTGRGMVSNYITLE